MPAPFTGSCICGGVRYECSAESLVCGFAIAATANLKRKRLRVDSVCSASGSQDQGRSKGPESLGLNE